MVAATRGLVRGSNRDYHLTFHPRIKHNMVPNMRSIRVRFAAMLPFLLAVVVLSLCSPVLLLRSLHKG